MFMLVEAKPFFDIINISKVTPQVEYNTQLYKLILEISNHIKYYNEIAARKHHR